MSRPVQVVIWVLVSLVAAFALMLFVALRTQVTDVSGQKPYADIINVNLVLKRPAVMAKNLPANVYANPYVMKEKAREEDLPDEALPRYTLPAGTALKFTHAKLFRSGVSGFPRAVVLGTVYLPDLKAEVAFEYQWGTSHVSLTGNEKDFYTFPLAAWQDRATPGQFRF